MSREDGTATSGHSSTAQWQSFEMRMRQRRLERCLLRAETALEAGNADDARAAIEEARVLDPSAPEFEALSAAVVERQQAAQRDAVRHKRGLVAAAALLLITTAAGVGIWQRLYTPLTPVAVETSGIPATPQATVALASAPLPNTQADVVSDQVVASSTTKPGSTESPEPVIPTVGSAVPLVAPTAGQEVAIALPVIPDSARNTPDLAAPVPGLPLPALPEVKSVSLPAPAANPTPAVDEEAGVRATLTKYEMAYSGLDVSAAQAIWPGVDARALARAFEGLASQRVSLGSCSVAIEGASARADCKGTATWTPKIGGGTHSESRNLRFELQNVGGEWQIVRADVR